MFKSPLLMILSILYIFSVAGCGAGKSAGESDSAPVPEISTAPASLHFGVIAQGDSKVLTVTITNSGTDVLQVTRISFAAGSSSNFSITSGPTNAIISPGNGIELEITYEPDQIVSDTGTIIIQSNDDSKPQITISLSGNGTGDRIPPELNIEGFGAITKGAASSPSGYISYHVTSLQDSGPGTLRDAVSEGSRYIVFDVGGTITLQSNLLIVNSYITIDGDSAPYPGITVLQPGNIRTSIEPTSRSGPAHDIVISYLRMDGKAESHTNDGDILGLDGQEAPVYNIVIDHVTAIASTDGVFDFWEEVYDVTISWNLILDTVTACHLSTGDESKKRERISFHHNVFARNNERQIRLRHNTQQIDFVNNVIYGWGWLESGAAGLHIAYDGGEINPSINVVKNAYHHIYGLGGENDAIIFESGVDVGKVFFSGNILPAEENDAISTSGRFNVPIYARVTEHDAGSLKDSTVPYVGTNYPTPDEEQILNEIRSKL